MPQYETAKTNIKTMNIKTELKKTDHEDYFELCINGVKLGTWEISQLRQLIGDIDNIIHKQ